MIVAYARVSTDRQDAENQRFEIERYLKSKQLAYDEFIEETVSGKTSIADRKFGELMERSKRGDTIIVSETSRISRRLNEVLNTIQICIDRGITVIAVKENFTFADDINSKVIAFAFGLAAEIERNLISARTKEALARKKAEGVVLGRPPGSYEPHHYKLYGKDEEIIKYLESGVPVAAIARLYKVHRSTAIAFIERQGLRRTIHMRRWEAAQPAK